MRVIYKIEENPKFFYSFARLKSHVKTPIGPLIIDDDPVTDPVETAEALKSHLESV